MEGIKKEIGVLTQSKSIPYEVLKYLGYSHNIVNLMWGLCTKTRDTYMAMRASNYFESMMQTIELDEIKLKFLYFQEGNKPVCTKDLECRDCEKYTGSIPCEVNPIVKFCRSQLIWIKVKLRIDSISPIRCSDACDRGLLNMILCLPCVTEIRCNSTFFDDLANQYNFVLDGLIEKNKRYDFGCSVKIDNDAKIPIKYFSCIRQLEYPSVKTGFIFQTLKEDCTNEECDNTEKLTNVCLYKTKIKKCWVDWDFIKSFPINTVQAEELELSIAFWYDTVLIRNIKLK